MRYLSIAGLSLFGLLFLVLCIQNMKSTPVALFNWSVTLPLSVTLLGTYVLGMATGWVVLSFLKRSVKAVQRKD